MWTMAAWICAVALSLLSLRFFPLPYLWIFLACAMAFFVTASMDGARRALWFNVACISVGLGVFEYYLWTSGDKGFAARRVYEGNFPERLHAPHEQLGWAPQAGSVVTQRLSFEEELIYDASYTIGPNGWRISSATNAHTPSRGCVLFFGDSFTFGQGLADDETLPFRVHEKSAQRYRTYNFGVNGYGAHQMLSALQHGLVKDTVQCEATQVTDVFYQAITDHVRRSAGRSWFERRGPRYVLTPDGDLRPEGRFEDHDDYAEEMPLMLKLRMQIYKSVIYQRIVQSTYMRKYSDYVLNLYMEIVHEARRMALADYPGAEFHVLLWDEDNADNRAIRDGLRQRGITVHLMSDILPNYRADDLNEEYRIHARDAHPNARANKLIARYIVGEILNARGSELDVNAAAPALRSRWSPTSQRTRRGRGRRPSADPARGHVHHSVGLSRSLADA
jgi:hypothetical protein